MHALTEHIAQCVVEDVRGRMIAHRGVAALAIDL